MTFFFREIDTIEFICVFNMTKYVLLCTKLTQKTGVDHVLCDLA